MDNTFLGPLFIVGMPRSGTKLLRMLLNNHSKIAIPSYETEILPYWVSRWEEFGNLSNFNLFKIFYNRTQKEAFFYFLKQNNENVPSATEWYNACGGKWSVSEVFEALVRLVTNSDNGIIWGDKSPSYITHIPLLKKLYPQAKIIHIVRDVRDYCLSINDAWGKNMIRAAQRWADDVHQVRLISYSFPQDIFEVRYEDLLDDPKNILQDICKFCGIEFEEDMLILSSPSENYGAAKGYHKIVANNKEKWRYKLRPTLVKSIEELCRDELMNYGYSFEYKQSQLLPRQ